MAPRSTPLLIAACLFLGLPEALAGPTIGASWHPIADDDSLESGLSVGEFDGLIRPPLTPYIGWTWERHQVLSSLNWVVFSSTTGDVTNTLGNLRLSVDYRYLFPERLDAFRIWVGSGIYQLIPILADQNPAYTDSETAVAETLTSERRALLAGTGIRLGIGGEFEIRTGIFFGINHHFVTHLNFQNLNDSVRTNTLSRSETGIHATVQF